MWAKTAQGNERYWCRVCNKKGFMDGKKLTAEEKQRLYEERRQQREQEERERQRRAAELADASYWRGYHDALRDVGRRAWAERGLPEQAQDWFVLGTAVRDGRTALTIPYHNRVWAVETVQYRLLGQSGSGKYRFEQGYPAAPFYCDTPDNDWPYIIVEGAIKAAVLWWRLVMERSQRYNVVAVPSKTPGRAVSERLGDEVDDRTAFIMLDPDASAAEQLRVGSHFRDPRYVSMPFKIDDAINDGFDPYQVNNFLRQATLEPL